MLVRIRIESHPMWVRGLKHYDFRYNTIQQKSHPMWVRGLKHPGWTRIKEGGVSHPMWVRGLKLKVLMLLWSFLGRILCGCVD